LKSWKKVNHLLSAILICSSAGFCQQNYHTNEALSANLAQLADKNPSLAKCVTVATSFGQNKIQCMVVSTGKPEAHPGVLIVAGVDGDDLISTEAALYFVQDLLHNARVDSISALLDKTTFYVIPRLNPDAARAFFTIPQMGTRTNLQPADDDVDGVMDEDGPEDLDKNGVITLMRVSDPEGSFVADDKDPQLLRKPNRERGEGGVYKVYPEGRDSDADGRWNEDGVGGTQLPLNFPFAYRPFVSGSGQFPLSAVETRGLADFCFQHPNIMAVFTFTRYDNIFHAWPVKQEKAEAREGGEGKPLTAVLPADAAILNQIAERFKTMTGAQDPLPALPSAGDLAQWAYYHYGRWSWAAPAWWPPLIKSGKDSSANKEAKSKPAEKDTLAGERRLLHWLQAAKIDGFVPWHEISHPDFPGQKVEVGGFKPYVGVNPPVDSIAQINKRFTSFFMHLASLLPHMAIKQTRVESLHERVFRIEAVLSNKGFLTSNSELGKRVNWVQKVVAELQWPDGVTVLSGVRRQIIEAVPGHSGVRLSWVLSGQRGQRMVLRVTGPTGVASEQTITLP
jgi:hypothetical protein